jgi:excisionase family DNA binding protein
MSAKRRFQSVAATAQQSTGALDGAHQPHQVVSPYLTSAEAIVYLRLDGLDAPLSALYRLITEHKLPHGRRGNLYLFDTRELDAWVKGFPSAIEMARTKRSA